MTYDTKGIWRCYEIKISKSDFHSKAHNTFIGHYNYYVMTQELYEQVKDEIPKHIGVYVKGVCRKKAKRQELGVDEQTLKNSMIRSLCREVQKKFMSNDPWYIEIQDRQIAQYKRQMEEYQRKYWDLMMIGIDKYGPRWYREESHV